MARAIAEPETDRQPAAAPGGEWFGHPRGLSTLFFALAHLSYDQPIMLVGVTLLSVLYGLLTRWRQNIWPAIPAVEEIVSSRPERCLRITGRAARVTFIGPNSSVSI